MKNSTLLKNEKKMLSDLLLLRDPYFFEFIDSTNIGFKKHPHKINSVVYSSNRVTFVTANVDKTARICAAATGKELHNLKRHRDSLTSAIYSPDGKNIVTAMEMTAHIRDTATGKKRCQLKGHTGYVNSIAYSPDGKNIVTASDDKTARIWDATTGKELRKLEGHRDEVDFATYSHFGEKIVTIDSENVALFWNSRNTTDKR